MKALVNIKRKRNPNNKYNGLTFEVAESNLTGDPKIDDNGILLIIGNASVFFNFDEICIIDFQCVMQYYYDEFNTPIDFKYDPAEARVLYFRLLKYQQIHGINFTPTKN